MHGTIANETIFVLAHAGVQLSNESCWHCTCRGILVVTFMTIIKHNYDTNEAETLRLYFRWSVFFESHIAQNLHLEACVLVGIGIKQHVGSLPFHDVFLLSYVRYLLRPQASDYAIGLSPDLTIVVLRLALLRDILLANHTTYALCWCTSHHYMMKLPKVASTFVPLSAFPFMVLLFISSIRHSNHLTNLLTTLPNSVPIS